MPFDPRETPNADTGAAILEARRTRARYDSAKDLINGLEGNRPKKNWRKRQR